MRLEKPAIKYPYTYFFLKMERYRFKTPGYFKQRSVQYVPYKEKGNKRQRKHTQLIKSHKGLTINM